MNVKKQHTQYMTKEDLNIRTLYFYLRINGVLCERIYMNEVKEKYFIEHTVEVKWRFIDKFCWNISDE